MRESFNGLGDLMGYYQFLKFDVSACPTILPKKDMPFGNVNPRKAQTIREGKMSFIGDIEGFVRAYYIQQPGTSTIPMDLINTLFHFTLCPHLTRFKSLGEIVLHFKRHRKTGRRKLPYKLNHRQLVHEICRDIREKAELYYCSMGLIEGDHDI